METLTTSRYAHEVETLAELHSASMQCSAQLWELTNHFSQTGLKSLFAHLYHTQFQCVSELEEKVAELGGIVTRNPGEIGSGIEEDLSDPLSHDRAVLLAALNQETHVMHLYTEARKRPMPFDIRMLLQRQQLQIREALERLSDIYITYPHRTVTGLHGVLAKSA